MKIDQVFNEHNDELHITSGELIVEDETSGSWEAKLYGVENQRFFTDAMKDDTKERLTFETDRGTLNGIISVEALDSTVEESVITLKGVGHLNGLRN
ncbi:hypothetical protein ACFPU1_06575 [Thalassorhabdus alkalitolerans]|uniref:Uncharacterized protein n=1 Tax=Thalassorhabdus alkalitolerans TaxID=2282697 RepID=A0ABW0YPZ8_9BACI|nr:hypothetical protein [Thalassobacillus sp. C254]